jgi:ribosome-binding ATPase YchF (GTP1/OBG family)
MLLEMSKIQEKVNHCHEMPTHLASGTTSRSTEADEHDDLEEVIIRRKGVLSDSAVLMVLNMVDCPRRGEYTIPPRAEDVERVPKREMALCFSPSLTLQRTTS